VFNRGMHNAFAQMQNALTRGGWFRAIDMSSQLDARRTTFAT